MRVVVLGAGTVGTWIADLLEKSKHSVTVVDSDAKNIQRINDELDVKAIKGSGSDSTVLFQAGILDADICLAVTGCDEVNLVACSLAKAMGAHRTIARVYAPVFRNLSTFDYERHFNIDRLLSLERLAAIEMAHGIRSADSLAVENLAHGKLEMVELTIRQESSAINTPLREINLPRGVRIGTIEREGKMWIAGAEDQVLIGDRITLIGDHDELEKIKKRFQKKTEPTKKVVIAGGGETGFHLAQLLAEKKYAVRLLESDPARCDFLAHLLPHVTVILADATRRTALDQEHVGSADVFAACTGDDENNIMCCVEAKELGTQTILAIVDRPDYANVVGKLGIDLAVSPRNVMAKQIISFLNKGPVISKLSLGSGNIGIYEIEVKQGCAATQFDLQNLPLPPACLIMAVIRQDYVRVPGANDHLQDGDNVVALVDNRQVDQMLTLFEPGS